jgi:cytochrome c peroxidase
MAQAFAVAFPGEASPVTLANAVRAIASFERTLATADSGFDRYLFGDERGALSPAAIEGMGLFFSERLGCSACHSGITFAGPVQTAAKPVAPRFASNGHGGEQRALVRIPSLRNVAVTAPYMRDGALASLDEVVEHYDRGAPLAAQPLPRLGLTPHEKAGLKAFLESLTDRPYLDVSRP